MTLKEISQKLDHLEEICIKNPNKYINQYLAKDIGLASSFEEGYLELITNTDLYNYWIEIAKELLPLLNAIQESIDKGETNFMLRFVAIKRVVDSSLLKVSNEQTILNDLGIISSLFTGILLKLDSSKKDQSIQLIFNTLKANNFIDSDTEYSVFQAHFSHSNIIPNKINWIGKLTALSYLLKSLSDTKLTNEASIQPKEIATHFTFKNKSINIRSLYTTRSKLPKDYPEISNLVEMLSGLRMVK